MEWSKCRSSRMRLESSRLTLHHVWSSSLSSYRPAACHGTPSIATLQCNRWGCSGEVAGSRSCEHVASQSTSCLLFLTVQWAEITSRAVPRSWGDFSLPSIPINFDTDTYEAVLGYCGNGDVHLSWIVCIWKLWAIDLYHTGDYILHMIIGCITCWIYTGLFILRGI